MTDPVAEAAMDCDTSDSGSQSQDDGPDDASLDEMQAAEAAVIADPENYEVHAAVRFPCPALVPVPHRTHVCAPREALYA